MTEEMQREGELSLEAWCLERAAALSVDGQRTPGSDAVWDVIDEIRRRKSSLPDSETARGVWMSPDSVHLVVETDDGELDGLEHDSDAGWLPVGMYDQVPDEFIRLVPQDGETEWGVRVYGLEPEETGTEAWARSIAETHEGYVVVQRRTPGPWTEVQS